MNSAFNIVIEDTSFLLIDFCVMNVLLTVYHRSRGRTVLMATGFVNGKY